MAGNNDLDWWVWSQSNDKTFLLTDHFGSFDAHNRNQILDQLPAGSTCYSEYIFPDAVKAAYPNIELKFSALMFLHGNSIFNVSNAAANLEHGPLEFKNFICSFNRSDQKTRHWLLAALNNLGWLNPRYVSKHFELDLQQISLAGMDVDSIDPDFIKKTFIFDFTDPTDHVHNMAALSPLIQDSFVNLVTESMIDSNVPFPTEKFLYPIANKRLWLAFAPPNYHKMINQVFKLELYPCFDYYFDSIFDPVQRMKAMLGMLEPYSRMSRKEWKDLYIKFQPIIEYNYNQLANFDFFRTIVDLDQRPMHYDDLASFQTSNDLKYFLECKEQSGKA